MTGAEFHQKFAIAVENNKMSEFVNFINPFVNELADEISNAILFKVTPLTGGLVSGLLRQYADEIDEYTDMHGKMLAATFFINAKITKCGVNVPFLESEQTKK